MNLKAIVMAGGRGTRLMPLTKNLPKPMLPLDGKPVLERVLLHLRSYGFYDVGVTLGYLPDRVIAYFRNGEGLGMNLTYFVEKTPLGTAGGVKNAETYLADDFLVMSGDGYSETDLSALMRYHGEKRSPFTLVATPCDEPSSFGVVRQDEDGKLVSFLEKPDLHMPALVNVGTYAVNKSVLSRIPEGFYDFGKDLLPRLVGSAYVFEDYGYWSDVGTPESYCSTDRFLSEKSSLLSEK